MFFRQKRAANHGYEPQRKLWKQIPLRGIVQLTNSATLRFRNWSFNNKRNAFDDNLCCFGGSVDKTFCIDFFVGRYFFGKRGQITGHYGFFHGGTGSFRV
jgi:hypothetical protein